MAAAKGSAAYADSGLYMLPRAAGRRIDRDCAVRYGLPTLVLMENAAAALADTVLDVLGSRRAGVIAVCGPGNNGGDGLAAARHLSNAGVPVSIVLGASPAAYTGDAAVQLKVAQRMKLPFARPSALTSRASPAVVIDAIFGTGLDRPVTGPLARLIESVNAARAAGAKIVSADIPSGLDCDTAESWVRDTRGRVSPPVRAHVTVSFVGLKPAFLTPAGRQVVGDVVIADIGAPAALVAKLGKAGGVRLQRR